MDINIIVICGLFLLGALVFMIGAIFGVSIKSMPPKETGQVSTKGRHEQGRI